MNRFKRALLPTLFCITGLVVALSETVFSGFKLQRHDLGDTRFLNYTLEHELRWLTGHLWHPDLFDRPYFFPAHNVGAYADVCVGALPVYAPLRLFLSTDSAFLAYGFLVCAVNFAAMYLLLRRGAGFAQLASCAGAGLFAFANTRMMMGMHWQMFPHYWSVLCLFALCALTQKLSANKTRLAIFVGMFAVVAQLWAGYYLGWFLVFGLAVVTPVALLLRQVREPILRALWTHRFVTVGSVVFSAAVAYPLARAYLAGAAEAGMRPYHEVLTMLPLPQTWVNMGHQSVPYGFLSAMFAPLRQIPMDHEQRANIGFVSLAVMLAGFIVARRRPGVLLAAVAFFGVILFATQLQGTSLWRLVYDFFPGAQAIRAVSRISLLLLLPAAVGVAAAIDALQKLQRKTLGTAVAFGLSALCIAEQGHAYGAYDIAQNRRDIQAIARRIHPRCEAFLVSPVGDGGPYWKHQLDAMSAQLVVGVPTINGYAGRAPAHWDLADVRINNDGDAQSVAKRLTSWMEYAGIEDYRVCHVKVGFGTERFDASFAPGLQTITARVGERVPVRLTVTNAGAEPWPADGRILLALQFDRDQRVFGPAGLGMPREVKPGESLPLEFYVSAPTQPGSYEPQFRMVNRQLGWFGELAPEIRLEVFAAQ